MLEYFKARWALDVKFLQDYWWVYVIILSLLIVLKLVSRKKPKF